MARNYNYHTAVFFPNILIKLLLLKQSVYDNWEVFMWKPLAAWFDLACTNNKLKCEVLCEKQNNSFAWLKNVEQLFDCAQFTLFFYIYKHIIINQYS